LILKAEGVDQGPEFGGLGRYRYESKGLGNRDISALIQEGYTIGCADENSRITELRGIARNISDSDKSSWSGKT